MFKIIGANQVEYGPVSTEQLRQWIAEGRADGNTKAQLEGTTEWKTLREFPEFAGLPVVNFDPDRPVDAAPGAVAWRLRLSDGSESTDEFVELDKGRLWRDVRVAGLHGGIYTSTTMELFGRILCGKEPNTHLL